MLENEFTLKSNPDGAKFFSGPSHAGNLSPEELFEQAVYFERLAHSGELSNPQAALKRAHDLLEKATDDKPKELNL